MSDYPRLYRLIEPQFEQRLVAHHTKKAKFRSFDVGDLVLIIRRPIVINRKTQEKFASKWEGPYVVTKIFPNWAYDLSNHDRQVVYACVNGKFVKKFFT